MKKKQKSKAKTAAAAESLHRIRLAPSLALMLLGTLLVLGARARQMQLPLPRDYLPTALWSVSSLAVWLFLRAGRYRGPGGFPAGILLLGGLGVLAQSRMQGALEDPRWTTLLIQPLGFFWMTAAWWLTRRGRISGWQSLWPLAIPFALALPAGVLLLGNRIRGAAFGPGGLTPTEGLKLLVPFVLAGFFAATESKWRDRPCWRPPLSAALPLAVGWGALCVLLMLQRDLGMLLLLSATLAALLPLVTRRWSWAGLFAACATGGAWAAAQLFPHGARRLQAWRDPFADPTGAGWQVLQGLSGLYAGGLGGAGWGAGRPDRLPIADSDFIYAVYGEELGFVGCLLLLCLYYALIRQGFGVAARQRELFPLLLAAGLTASLALQVFVNIAGVVNLLPITGIPLPYLSQGGSSFWVVSLQFGILLGLSDPPPDKKKK